MPSNSLDIASFVVVVVGTYLLHSTILLMGVWLVVRTGRVRSHVLAERLWKMAAVLGLATTPVQLALGWSSPVFDVTLGFSEDTLRAAADGTNAASDSSFHAVPPPRIGKLDRRALNTEFPPFQGTDVTEDLDAGLNHNGNEYADDAQLGSFSRGVRVDLRDDLAVDEPAALVARTEMDLGHICASEEPPRNGRFPSGTATQPRRSHFAFDPSTIARYALGGAILTAVFYVGGSFVLLVQTLVFRRRCAVSREIGDGPARRILDRLLQKNCIRRQVRLLSSDAFHEPVAYGLVRWTIVLPNGMEQRLGKDELKALLAHEVAHLVRGDVTWLWIGRVLCSCLAFQPLNFLARRRWQHAAEFLCDDWAISRGGSAISLARCLTRIAEWRLDERECAAGLAAGGSKAKIVLRVERLVNATGPVDVWTRPNRRVLLRVAVVVTAACLVCIAPRVVLPARANDTHNHDAQASFGESDHFGRGVRVPAIEADQDWHLLEEELLQLDGDLSYALKLLEKTSQEPEVHESAERMRRHAIALQQRRHVLAERMKKELDR